MLGFLTPNVKLWYYAFSRGRQKARHIRVLGEPAATFGLVEQPLEPDYDQGRSHRLPVRVSSLTQVAHLARPTSRTPWPTSNSGYRRRNQGDSPSQEERQEWL